MATSLAEACTSLANAFNIDPSPRGCVGYTVSNCLGMALFIIGCIGAAGVFPGSSIGWVTVGLGAGAFACRLISLDYSKKIDKTLLLTSFMLSIAPIIVVGALGGTGLLSMKAVGAGALGTYFGYQFLVACGVCCTKVCDTSTGDAQPL